MAHERPDAVLLDLSCPETFEDGLTLLAELTGQTPPLPVPVLTAQGALADRVEVAHRKCEKKNAYVASGLRAVMRALHTLPTIWSRYLVNSPGSVSSPCDRAAPLAKKPHSCSSS